MDKGLSINEVHNFISINGPYTDIVKLGFGTSFVTNLREKIKCINRTICLFILEAPVQAFLIRNQFDEYIAVCKDYGINYVEVSDGSVVFHMQKNTTILKLTKHATVFE